MSSAEPNMKIGIMKPFGWIESHGFWATFCFFLLISPVGMLLVGFIFEFRLVPIDPQHQFIGFIFGDVFLALAMASFMQAIQFHPTWRRWHRRRTLHPKLLLLSLLVAVCVTIGEVLTRFYPLTAVLSPTKLFHNLFVGGGYGYLIMLFLAIQLGQLIDGTADGIVKKWVALGWVAMTLWFGCQLLDMVPGLLDQVTPGEKAHYAHTDDWLERWKAYWQLITSP